jgi:hypothetical protein
MNRQNEDNKSLFGTVTLIVLLFLLVCSFAKNRDKPAGRAVQTEMASLIHANTVALNNVQQAVFQKSVIPYSIGMKFNLFSKTSRIIAFNRLTGQKIISLQKTALSVKPITFHWYINQYHYLDDDIPPILS